MDKNGEAIMILPSPNIEIFGVYDRGVPNLERVVLRVSRPTNLAEYLMIMGVRAPLAVDMIYPIADQSLWLGAIVIECPSWVFIFTGTGKAGVSQEKNTGQPLHTLYWNRAHVMLAHNDVVPALVHIDSIDIGNKPNKSLADIAKSQDNDSASLAQLMASLTAGGAT